MAVAPTPSIGWIGTGRMGYQLALRLLTAGYDVAACNRTRSKAEPLAEHGAKVVDQPVDLANRTSSASWSGRQGSRVGDQRRGGLLSRGDDRPKIVIDASTVSTEASRASAPPSRDRGAQFLAAPVSGNPKVVAAGKLTVAVSGRGRLRRRRAAAGRVGHASPTWARARRRW